MPWKVNITPIGYSERMAHSDYSSRGEKQSEFDPDATVPAPEYAYTMCPRCKDKGPYLDHGQSALCKCGLGLQVFGNCLTVWEHGKPELMAESTPAAIHHALQSIVKKLQ